MKSLIKLTALSCLIGAAGISQAAGDFNPAKPNMTRLKEGVYQYSQFFYNSLVVISDAGVIVTDPSGAVRAAAMRKEINKLTDKPVTKVIYSHDHFDHSRGGQIFKDEGAEFIAQPDITYQNSMRVTVGGKQLDLHYYGPNDGTCMSVMHMPQDKLLFAVDWHLPGYVNEPHRLPSHNYVAILNTFKRVRSELAFDTVISGHGPGSSVALFEEDYRFVQALFDAVWQGMQAGKTTEELKQSVKLPKFSHWRGYEQNLPAHVERMAYSIWHGN